jgi:outer membrane immunogenic protein
MALKVFALLRGNFMIAKFAFAATAVLSIGAIQVASAADMAVKARPMPVAVYNWTGCYIGVSAGAKGAYTRDRVTTPGVAGGGITSPTTALDLGQPDDSTWLAGGQAGCNYQTGNWVFGIEGDAHAQRWSQSNTLAPGVPPIFVAGDRFDLSSDWQASARGRIGYAVDRSLFYVTGGAAFTQVRATSNWIPFGIFPGTLASDTKTLVGGTVGVGVEYAVTNNIILGAEGRYSYYGSQRFNGGAVAAISVPGAVVTFVNSASFRDVRVDTGEILFRASYKFGPGAVVAKY